MKKTESLHIDFGGGGDTIADPIDQLGEAPDPGICATNHRGVLSLKSSSEYANWDSTHRIEELQAKILHFGDLLEKKDNEIIILQDALVTLKDEVKFLEEQEPQVAAKTMAKKNRNLQVMWQRERSRAAKLKQELNKLEAELDKFKEGKASAGKAPMSFNPRGATRVEHIFPKEMLLSTDLKEWEEKCNGLREKLCASRSQIQCNKEQINKLKCILQKEVGGGKKELNEILTMGGQWRGRAEENALLKTKVRTLTKRLQILQGKEKYDFRDDLLQKNRQQIAKISETRRETQNHLEDELNQQKKEICGLKFKLGGVQARNSVLENEVRTFRLKLKVFLEKSANDDVLVDKLREELERQRKLVKSRIKESAFKSEVENLQNVIAGQKKQLKQKTDILNHLQSDIAGMSRKRSESIRAIFDECLDTENDYKVEFLKVENQKQRELAEYYKEQFRASQNKLVRKSEQVVHLTLDKEQDKRSSIKHKSKLSKESDLMIVKLRATIKEKDSIQATMQGVITATDVEMKKCKDQLNRQAEVHRRAMEDLRSKFLGLRDRIEN